MIQEVTMNIRDEYDRSSMMWQGAGGPRVQRGEARDPYYEFQFGSTTRNIPASSSIYEEKPPKPWFTRGTCTTRTTATLTRYPAILLARVQPKLHKLGTRPFTAASLPNFELDSRSLITQT